MLCPGGLTLPVPVSMGFGGEWDSDLVGFGPSEELPVDRVYELGEPPVGCGAPPVGHDETCGGVAAAEPSRAASRSMMDARILGND